VVEEGNCYRHGGRAVLYLGYRLLG
jgi:hypothetical protein